MGGRGSSSGISDKGNKYGTQYHTVLKDGNIKFIKANDGASESLLETMTKGRVYVLINSNNNIKSINYFDNDNKRSKRIDIDHSHAGMNPHVQHGYYGTEETAKIGATKLSPEEKAMVDRVLKIWDNWRGK